MNTDEPIKWALATVKIEIVHQNLLNNMEN